MKIIYPDYNNSILNLSNSILKHYGIASKYPTLTTLDTALSKNYQNVVLIIYDGLGVNILKRHLNNDAFLNGNIRQTITSVFPPTTAAATTSIYASQPPAAHGWLGWALYFKEHKKIIELFSGKDFYMQTPAEITGWEALPYQKLWNKIRETTKDTVKTHKLFPAFIPSGTIHSVDEQCESIKSICQNGDRNFILSYWAEPDKTMHNQGPNADIITQIITEINDKIEQLSDALSDTLIIITADHGQITLEKSIIINDYPELIDCLDRPLSIEDRAISVALKSGMDEQFKTAFDKYLSKDFILLSKAEVLEKQLFGTGDVLPAVHDFIGDYLIIATGTKSITQKVENMADFPKLVGIHAGLTEDEMLVPLILIEKK